jgi:hypothetical protein
VLAGVDGRANRREKGEGGGGVTRGVEMYKYTKYVLIQIKDIKDGE